MADVPDMHAGALPGSGAVGRRLAYYRPGLRQEAHSHHRPHVSIVVAGSFRETTARGERLVCQGHVGFRADCARHSVSYGPAGALVLSLGAHAWLAAGVPAAGVGWVRAAVPFARQMIELAGANEAEAEDALVDLWAAAREVGEERRGKGCPAWLAEAAERLLAAPENFSIAALASSIGVHRVHLSRRFLRHFGMTPSLFRRRAMTARALAAALGEEESLAGAAVRAGFADQSHMARAMRESCGMGAGRIRRLLGGATSVQSAGPSAR